MLSSTAKNLYWMGRYLQRAKSTARLIEATQRMALQSRGEEAAGGAASFGMAREVPHTLRPDGDPDAGGLDYFAWSEVLACIGAVRTYRRIYRSALDPAKVAELMMLRRDVPRSVHHCLSMVDLSMGELADAYGTRGEADRLAGHLHARLRTARI